MASKKRPTPYCLNCETSVVGLNYCPNCGQENNVKNVPLLALFQDLISNIFGLDTKLVQSLKPLLFYPGKLTQKYTRGQRMTFVPPTRMYIAVSFIFFLVVQFTTSDTFNLIESTSKEIVAAVSDATGDSLDVFDPTSLKNTFAKLDSMGSTDNSDSLQANINRLFGTDSTGLITLDNSIGQYNLEETLNSSIANETYTESEDSGSVSSDDEILLTGLVERFPTIMFFLLPVFAMILKLLYFGSKRYLFEHVIFALHYHAFVFILLTAHLIVCIFLPVWVIVLLSISVSVYIYFYLIRSMKEIYQQNTFLTYIKGTVLFWAHGVVLFFGWVASIGIEATL